MLSRVILAVALSSILLAGPTEQRDWKSTTGTTLTAVANGITEGQVEFLTTSGKTLSVPLDKLAPAERDFLVAHFRIPEPKAGGPTVSGDTPAQGLKQPLGKLIGPIEVSRDTHYMLYLPTTLKMNRKASLLFFTNSGGGNKQNKSMVKGSEITGWITAESMESNNANDVEKNHELSKACIAHIIASLPVDRQRIYFTGSSGGAATAFFNAANCDHAGVISSLGYIPAKVPKGGDYFICDGATDFNRYYGASAAEAVGRKNSFLRFSKDGHTSATSTMLAEGMIWLNIRYLAGKGLKLGKERLDFEAQVLGWIADVKGKAPHHAYHAAIQMKETFKVSAANSTAYDAVLSELGNESNRRYVAGLTDIDAWARKNLAPLGDQSRMAHTTPALQSSALELSKTFAGVPELEEIGRKLGETTGTTGK